MQYVKKYPYNKLNALLLGKKVHFISDCQLFPNFDITAKPISISLINGIPLIKAILNNGKTIQIDGGMSNLQFEVLSK